MKVGSFEITIDANELGNATQQIARDNIFFTNYQFISLIDLLDNQPPYILRTRRVREELIEHYVRTIQYYFINFLHCKFIEFSGWKCGIGAVELTT